KTLVDSLDPAVSSLSNDARNSENLFVACTRAHEAAERGCAATAQMEARIGRGSYQGPRSIGHIDPGATSMVTLFKSLSQAIYLASQQK
ncbi:MAG: DAK2 domain-containing protein, partial [Actinomycetota bacterium]|nr:DAK2 domain-containing protein [Actinomycetota bacterium]